MVNLIVLTPAVAGVIARFIVSWRLKNEADQESPINFNGDQVFFYPRVVVDSIFVCAVILPIIVFILPESVVLDARFLFDSFAVSVSLVLLFSWLYLRIYKIKVKSDCIEYGAFFVKRINFSTITGIKYHWVNDGISLRLYSGGRVVTFEGGVVQFDKFAKLVKHRLPKDVHVKTVGKASFE